MSFQKHQADAKVEQAKHTMGQKAAQAKDKLAETGQNIKEGFQKHTDDAPVHEKGMGEKIKEGFHEGVEKLKATGEAVKEKFEHAVGLDHPNVKNP